MSVATILYPAELPRPERGGYVLNHVDPTRRTTLQTGRARQRRVYTRVPTMVQATWRLKNAEAVLFEGFFRHTLQDGVEWFQCPLQTPLGVREYDARFAGMYQGPELIGPAIWSVTATLELIERQTIDAALTSLPQFIFGMSIIDVAINREWPQ